MKDSSWITIPILKYVAIDATLTFWETLGFKVTFRQDRPYKYAVLEREGSHLHFHYSKNIEILTPGNGCLIIINDVQKIYQEFCDALKRHLGRIPSKDLPRISRMKPARTRFTVTDPSGNSVIFIQQGPKDEADYESTEQKDATELGKSIALALKLKDFKEDYLAAAKVLDNALKKHLNQDEKGIQHAEAFIIRAELARLLNDHTTEKDCYKSLGDLEISADKIFELKSKHRYDR
ncbi:MULTISPECIES: VOC family protein [unclassified Sphingobacterium]|uniref:VOC family protein n=1 Tax=unclassified Sphingobacterium TaxID=2609468 RepID=UPI0025CE454A|nr:MULTISPECIES: VOC family protein [unclassified Sphingobacterium]